MMQREVHQHFDTRSTIESSRRSGVIDENVTCLVMEMYRKRPEKEDRGGLFQKAPLFTYISA